MSCWATPSILKNFKLVTPRSNRDEESAVFLGFLTTADPSLALGMTTKTGEDARDYTVKIEY
jgi:hypothetical protein